MLPVLGRDRGGGECVSDAILDCDLAEGVRGKCTRELKTVKNIYSGQRLSETNHYFI